MEYDQRVIIKFLFNERCEPDCGETWSSVPRKCIFTSECPVLDWRNQERARRLAWCAMIQKTPHRKLDDKRLCKATCITQAFMGARKANSERHFELKPELLLLFHGHLSNLSDLVVQVEMPNMDRLDPGIMWDIFPLLGPFVALLLPQIWFISVQIKDIYASRFKEFECSDQSNQWQCWQLRRAKRIFSNSNQTKSSHINGTWMDTA
jgi:hypothetical protein